VVTTRLHPISYPLTPSPSLSPETTAFNLPSSSLPLNLGSAECPLLLLLLFLSLLYLLFTFLT